MKLRKPRFDTETETEPAGVPASQGHSAPAVGAGLGAVSGIATGAALGTFGGPIGVVAGAVIGAAAGAAAGVAVVGELEARDMYEGLLDEVIGVSGGDLGAASPNLPPARIGAYSAGSAGAAGLDDMLEDAPDEGPMPRSD